MTDGIYTQVLARFRLVAMLSLIQHRRNIALFYWDSPNFVVKEIRQFGVNVIACQL